MASSIRHVTQANKITLWFLDAQKMLSYITINNTNQNTPVFNWSHKKLAQINHKSKQAIQSDSTPTA